MLLTVLTLTAAAAPEHQLIHGEEVPYGAAPEAGALLVRGQAFGLEATVFFCSASLIAPDVVLTAAHCVDIDTIWMNGERVPLEGIQFFFTQQVDVSRYNIPWGVGAALPDDASQALLGVFHPDWVGEESLQGPLAPNNDIGLFFLERPRFRQPLAILPTRDEGDLIQSGDPIAVVGWGQQSPDPREPTGEKLWGDTIVGALAPEELQISASMDAPRTCHGDSGGPTLWSSPLAPPGTSSRRQIGVTSHSWDWTDCEGPPGVATRVDFHLDWLDTTLRGACEDGTRAWCDPDPARWGVLPPSAPTSEPASGCSNIPRSATWVGLFPLLALRRRRRCGGDYGRSLHMPPALRTASAFP